MPLDERSTRSLKKGMLILYQTPAMQRPMRGVVTSLHAAPRRIHVHLEGTSLYCPDHACSPDTLSMLDMEAIAPGDLSRRCRRVLQELGITTYRQLADITPGQLLSHKGFGVSSLGEVRARLGMRGLGLKDPDTIEDAFRAKSRDLSRAARERRGR